MSVRNTACAAVAAVTTLVGTAVHAQDPNAIPGLQVWLKADAINTADGGQVRQDVLGNYYVSNWNDSTAGGQNATQAMVIEQPLYVASSPGLNNKPAVRFDNQNDSMLLGDLSALFPSGATLFVVADIGEGVGGEDQAYNLYTTRTAPGNDRGWWRYTNGDGFNTTFRSERIESYPPGMPSSASHIFQIDSAPLMFEFFQNGESKGLKTDTDNVSRYDAGTDHRLSFGWDSSLFYGGDLAEILVYSGVLSEAQRGEVGTYLEQKYGLDTAYVPEPTAAAVVGLLVFGGLTVRRRGTGRAC